jgi:hypothetical protein
MGGVPVFENNMVKYSVNGVDKFAEVKTDTSFISYYRPDNQMDIRKKGFEFSLRFPEIQSLNCRFYIVGAYLYTHNRNLINELYYPVLTYPAGETVESDQLVTNVLTTIRFNNDKLMFSLTSQIVWFDRYRYRHDAPDGSSNVRTSSPVSGNIYDDNIQRKLIYPEFYVDFNNMYHIFDPKIHGSALPYSNLVNVLLPGYFLQESYPPVVQFNARLNKQIGKNLSVAVFANNIFNFMRYDVSKRTGSYYRRNTPLYFGSEFKWSF